MQAFSYVVRRLGLEEICFSVVSLDDVGVRFGLFKDEDFFHKRNES